jgi:type I restriction enzyme M protein
VERKKVAKEIKDEHQTKGHAGRFGAGLPPINDGSLLFLQHMISKMKPASEGGSRLAIVFNGSPLFSGAAGSGPSEVRRWIIENDWLEAVVALPDQLFYNTGISTYFWIVTNRKSPHRKGKVQLVDARDFWTKMRKSLGQKRKAISDEQIAEIVRLYGAFEENERVKILPNEAFGYLRITAERPLAEEVDSKGRPKPDPELRDNENVPLPDVKVSYEPDPTERIASHEYQKAIDDYMESEVRLHVPEAWVDHSKTKIGYEIPLTRLFYKYEPPRPLEEIDAVIKALEQEIQDLLTEVTE